MELFWKPLQVSQLKLEGMLENPTMQKTGLVTTTYLAFLDRMLGSIQQLYCEMCSLLLIQLTHFLTGFAKQISALTSVRTEHPDMAKNKFLM